MKTLLAAAAVATLALAGPVSAQMYQPMNPAPTQPPTYTSGTPSWMQDDGSSSDYPVHNPGDQSGQPMNTIYQGGIPTAPGTGFPAEPGQGAPVPMGYPR
jgi:hypothetical protein